MIYDREKLEQALTLAQDALSQVITHHDGCPPAVLRVVSQAYTLTSYALEEKGVTAADVRAAGG